MNRVPCPHCGFMNFSISAYCGRCERPLPKAIESASPVPAPVVLGAVRPEPKAAAVPTESAAPLPSGAGIGNVPPEPVESAATFPFAPGVGAVRPDSTGSAAALPSSGSHRVLRPEPTEAPARGIEATRIPPPPLALTPIPLTSYPPPTPSPLATSTSLTPSPTPARPPASPLASVPPPLPPLSLESPPPAVQPIELQAAGRQRKRPAGPDVGVHPDPDAEIPVTVPGGLRLLAARAIDATVILAYGAAVVFLGMLVTGATFATPSSGVLDTIAEWLSLNRELVEGSVGMTAAFGVAYGVWSAARGGQTLGRKLTNTVLVRRDGKPFTALRLLVRAVASLVSAGVLGAGFLWAIVDPYHRTWHDLLAGTVTVRRYVHVPGARSA